MTGKIMRAVRIAATYGQPVTAGSEINSRAICGPGYEAANARWWAAA